MRAGATGPGPLCLPASAPRCWTPREALLVAACTSALIPSHRAAQEPENAHSHLLSMVLGNSETVPVHGGRLALGTWQSLLLVELDGPRPRTVGVQVVGCRGGDS